MKYKLLTFLIIVAVMLPFFATTALAATVVDITSPVDEEVVTKEAIFSICGICIYDETTIKFEYWDKDSEEYTELLTTDEESSFKVGSNKLFGKSIELKYKGINKIKVIAYTKATKDEPQVNDYTITFSEEKKSNWFTEKWNWLTGHENK